jgi:hypothetical protein
MQPGVLIIIIRIRISHVTESHLTRTFLLLNIECAVTFVPPGRLGYIVCSVSDFTLPLITVSPEIIHIFFAKRALDTERLQILYDGLIQRAMLCGMWW